jgi:magnesium transporter
MIDQLLTPDLENLSVDENREEILEFLHGLRPMETAEILIELSPEKALSVLKILEKAWAAKVFRKLPISYKADITALLDNIDLEELVTAMSPDDRADLMNAVPPERRKAVLRLLPSDEQDDIVQLSRFAEATAGSIMTTDYIALDLNSTASQAIERIRSKSAASEPVSTIFAVDGSGRLEGSLTLAGLIRANGEQLLSEIMEARPPSINALNAKEEAVHVFSRYDLMALPVVDAEERLIGVIAHDDIVNAMEQDRTQDLERFMSITGAHENVPFLHTSIWSQFRNRIGWLLILALFGLVAGDILTSFGRSFSNFMVLAFYIPMLMGVGGNAGNQSAAVVIRSYILKEIKPKDAFSVVWKELRVALLLGLVLGVFIFGQALFTASDIRIPGVPTALDIGLAASIALIVQVIVSTIIGALLPLGAAMLNSNLALVSSQALATIADVSGMLIYFGTARLFLRI